MARRWLDPNLLRWLKRVELDSKSGVSQYVREPDGVPKTDFPGGPIHPDRETAEGYLWMGTEKGLVPVSTRLTLVMVAAFSEFQWTPFRGLITDTAGRLCVSSGCGCECYRTENCVKRHPFWEKDGLQNHKQKWRAKTGHDAADMMDRKSSVFGGKTSKCAFPTQSSRLSLGRSPMAYDARGRANLVGTAARGCSSIFAWAD